MIESIGKLNLTKYQEEIILELVNIINMRVCDAFKRDMHFIFTVNDPDKDNRLCFTVSTLDKENVLQSYINYFCAIKNNLSEASKIGFNRKLLSHILQDNEEKKACFYWLLDQLHDQEMCIPKNPKTI